MIKSIKINVSLVSILTCILLIQPGHANERNNFFAPANAGIFSNIPNDGPKPNQFPGKLQPSWSCILLGENGCFGTCSLMGALYGCETKSVCRKGIYCECNELYHFPKRDVPAENFQNLPLEELWNYRFKKTSESTALFKKILDNNEMKDYLSTLLRDAHITGDDATYLLGDEFPQLNRQLQKLVVNPHGLKSELSINGNLEYNNIADYFGDLFEWIKERISEKMESCRSKRRIFDLLRNINNKEDLKCILRQILLSGDDKLYNFVSSYLRRNGHTFEEENLHEPRRRFGRRPGCRKRKRCGRFGGGGMDFCNSGPPWGSWHGRPLRRKIIFIHNNVPIKLDADEDEIIEAALINELKEAEEENAGVAAPQSEVPKKQVEVISPSPPNMKPVNQEISSSAPAQGNTYMQATMPSLMTTVTQGPFMQDKAELYQMPLPEIKPYLPPTIPTSVLGNTSMPEIIVPKIPNLPDQELYSSSLSQMKPVSSALPTTPTQNIFQQDSVAPMMTYVPQVPVIPQIKNEILTPPPQIILMSSELPTPFPSQYTPLAQGAMTPISITNSVQVPTMNQLEEISTAPPQMKPMPLQLPTTSLSQYSTVMPEVMAPVSMNNKPIVQIPTMHSVEDISILSPQMKPISPISPSQNDFQKQETMGPVLASNTAQVPFMQQIEKEGENIVYNLPKPSTTTFYTDKSPEAWPSLTSQKGSSNTPQTVYEYVTSTPSMPSLNFDFKNITPPNMPSLNYNFENITPPNMPSLNFDIENITPLSIPSLSYDSETPSNMANQFTTQFENAMQNLPSSSLTSYTSQMSLPENGYSFQTSSLPASLNTSNMEWMSTPSSTFSTMSSNIKNMIPQPSWLVTETTNMTPQNEILSSSSMNSGLSRLQENLPNLEESNVILHSNGLPSSQTINQSFIQEDIPPYIQQSIPSLSSDSQNIKNEIEVVNNFTADRVQKANEMLQSNQNCETNMSVQPFIPQPIISDPGKKKKSLFYMVVDDTGNVVHSGGMDHDEEKHGFTDIFSRFPYNIPNYFSQGKSKSEN